MHLDVMCVPGAGPDSLQAPIVRYVSAGGGGSGQQQLDALYQRLSAEASGRGSLPLSAGRVRLCLQLGAAGGAASSKDGHQEDWLVCNQLCKGGSMSAGLLTLLVICSHHACASCAYGQHDSSSSRLQHVLVHFSTNCSYKLTSCLLFALPRRCCT
jgi:hypothetical protein